MRMWISIYCQKLIEKFHSSTLDRVIKTQMPNWPEHYPVVKATEYHRAGHGSLFHLNYGNRKDKLHKNSPPASVERVRGGAPIVIDIVSDPDDVAGYAQEQLEEYLNRRRGEGAKFVRDHLVKVQQIFSLCLKQSHYDDCFGRGCCVRRCRGSCERRKWYLSRKLFRMAERTRSGNNLVLKDA